MGVNDRDWIKPKPTLLDRWHELHPLAQNATVLIGMVLFVAVLVALGRSSNGGGSQAERDEWRSQEIQYAIYYADTGQLRRLLRENPDRLQISVEGMGPKDHLIHFVAHQATPAMMKVLLEFDADVQARGTAGRTPLHYAAARGEIEITKMLIAHKVNVSARDDVGFTPLMDAAGGDNDLQCFEVVQLLCDNGADARHAAVDGTTAEQVADEAGNRRIATLLRQLGADE